MYRIPVVIMLAALFAAAPALAHGPGGPGGPHGQGTSMQEELGITAEQADQVKAILKEQGGKRRAMNRGAGAQAPDQPPALDDETRARLANILNAGQMAKLEQRMAQRRGDHMRGPEDRMAKTMNLSPEQQEKVKTIFAESRDEYEQLRSADLAPEQRREKADTLHAQMREKMSGVLDEKQLAQFDAMHERHMKRREGSRHGGRHSTGTPEDATDSSDGKPAPK